MLTSKLGASRAHFDGSSSVASARSVSFRFAETRTASNAHSVYRGRYPADREANCTRPLPGTRFGSQATHFGASTIENVRLPRRLDTRARALASIVPKHFRRSCCWRRSLARSTAPPAAHPPLLTVRVAARFRSCSQPSDRSSRYHHAFALNTSRLRAGSAQSFVGDAGAPTTGRSFSFGYRLSAAGAVARDVRDRGTSRDTPEPRGTSNLRICVHRAVIPSGRQGCRRGAGSDSHQPRSLRMIGTPESRTAARRLVRGLGAVRRPASPISSDPHAALHPAVLVVHEDVRKGEPISPAPGPGPILAVCHRRSAALPTPVPKCPRLRSARAEVRVPFLGPPAGAHGRQVVQPLRSFDKSVH